MEVLGGLQALTRDTFRLLLFIIPGLVSLRIKGALAISTPTFPLKMTIDGLMFTLVDHALYGVVRWALSNTPTYSTRLWLGSIAAAVDDSPSWPGDLGHQFSQAGGFSILVIAVAVGFVCGVVRYHGWEFRLLRRLKMTNRTGENLVWAEALTKSSALAYAVVTCKDGARYMGVIDTFSEEGGNYEVFLSHAAQVGEDGVPLPIEGQGVLLTRENPIVRVELWNPGARANVPGGGQGHERIPEAF
jgi:hypothetical protein